MKCYAKRLVLITSFAMLSSLFSINASADIADKRTSSTHVVRKGSTNQPQYMQNDDATCIANAEAAAELEGRTRTTGAATYSCIHSTAIMVIFGPPPVAPCGPPPDMRVITCPAGTAPNWDQRATVGPPPTCAITWSPLTTPPDACRPIPVEPELLPAPTNLRTTRLSASSIKVDWDALPSGAGAYSFERCIGATCTTFSQLLCVTQPTATHSNLPSNIHTRYRVRASRNATCSNNIPGNLGSYTEPVAGTTTTTPVPPDPQPGTSCTGTTCTLTWTPAASQPEGVTVAGFYVVYGRSQTELTQSANVAGAGARTYQLTNMGTGTWFFAVQTYDTTGNRSVNSVVVERVVR